MGGDRRICIHGDLDPGKGSFGDPLGMNLDHSLYLPKPLSGVPPLAPAFILAAGSLMVLEGLTEWMWLCSY
jgi:hypothetical protein